MKISDIPTLIHVNQGVAWNIEGIPATLERWKESYGLDLDPEFQRGHVWDMETKIKFVEFVARGGVTQPVRFNSPAFGGHTHAKHSDLSEDIVLVDGKQRLTAILEFMDNKIAIFDGNYLKDFDNPHRLLLRMEITYQVNKLQTKRELYQWYIEMNEGQVAHSTEEIERVRQLLKEAK